MKGSAHQAGALTTPGFRNDSAIPPGSLTSGLVLKSEQESFIRKQDSLA